MYGPHMPKEGTAHTGIGIGTGTVTKLGGRFHPNPPHPKPYDP
jgi:hypothetical protein